jgi:hypothetical protein
VLCEELKTSHVTCLLFGSSKGLQRGAWRGASETLSLHLHMRHETGLWSRLSAKRTLQTALQVFQVLWRHKSSSIKSFSLGSRRHIHHTYISRVSRIQKQRFITRKVRALVRRAKPHTTAHRDTRNQTDGDQKISQPSHKPDPTLRSVRLARICFSQTSSSPHYSNHKWCAHAHTHHIHGTRVLTHGPDLQWSANERDTRLKYSTRPSRAAAVMVA